MSVPNIQNVNDIYGVIGDGLYQVLVIGIICLTMVPAAVQQYIMVFLSITPTWIHESRPNTSNGALDRLCRLNNSEWRWENQIEFSIVSEFHLFCDREHWIHFTTLSYFGVSFFGSNIMGYLSDRFGRKKILVLGLFLNITINLACSFLTNLMMFIILKAACGFFAAGSLMTMVVYCTECISEKKRTLGSMILWTFYSLGGVVLALTSYSTQNWRKLALFTSTPYISVLLVLFTLPESLAWIYDKGKKEELENLTKRAPKLNGKKIYGAINIAFTVQTQNMQKATLLHLFKPLVMAKKTLSLALGWIATATSFLGISLAAENLTGNLYRDFVIVTFGEVVSCFAAIYLAKRFGRRNTSIACMLCSGLSLVGVAFIPHPATTDSYKYLRLLLGVLGKILVTIVYDILYSWTAETYPTFLRSYASGLHQGLGYVGMMAAPWIALSLNRFHHSVPFFVMGGISIVSSILLLNFDETNGKGLTEILKKHAVASVDKLEECSVEIADKLNRLSVPGVDNKSFDATHEARYKDFEV